MESDEKIQITLLFRVSKGRKTDHDLDKCRLCFKMIKKGQPFKIIEEEYADTRQYYIHTKCLKQNKGVEKTNTKS